MCCPPPNPTNPCLGLLMLIMNIIIPGTGTMLNGCVGYRCCELIVIGFLQLITAPLCVGWVWSIWYGVIILGSARGGGHPYHGG